MFVDNPAIGSQKHDLGLNGGEPVLDGKPRRVRKIIRIVARDPASVRQAEALVQAGCLTFVVRIPYDGDTRISGGPSFRELRRSVCGGIIDDEKLEIAKSLAEYTANRGLEKSPRVKDRHEDGDGRIAHPRTRRKMLACFSTHFAPA